MITLYQMEISPFCDKIRRVLNVKGLPYALHEVGLLESQTGYRKINPSGKVPALADGGAAIICDSTEIARYLDEKYPSPALIPADARSRALNHVLEDWADESLYFYEVRLRFGMPENRARSMVKLLKLENTVIRTLMPPYISSVVKGQLNAQGLGRKTDAQIMIEVGRHLDALTELLSGQHYLLGDALMLADISVFCMLYCLQDTPEGAAEIARRPDVAAYMKRVDAQTGTKA